MTYKNIDNTGRLAEVNGSYWLLAVSDFCKTWLPAGDSKMWYLAGFRSRFRCPCGSFSVFCYPDVICVWVRDGVTQEAQCLHKTLAMLTDDLILFLHEHSVCQRGATIYLLLCSHIASEVPYNGQITGQSFFFSDSPTPPQNICLPLEFCLCTTALAWWYQYLLNIHNSPQRTLVEA